MITYGSGECWANTHMILTLCSKLGIPAAVRTRSNTLSYPDFHIDAYVMIDGTSYLVDCGHVDRSRVEFQPTAGYAYSVKSDGTIVITDYDGYITNLSIPSTLNGYTVSEIGANAFIYHFELQSVTIPDTVTAIDSGAFKQCTKLSTITLPADTVVASDAFTTTKTTMLGNTQLWIPDGITNKNFIYS